MTDLPLNLKNGTSPSTEDDFVHLSQTSSAMQKIRVGAVQAEPGWLNLEESVEKTVSLINQAAEKGVNVLGFPEVWIPGYPWSVPPTVPGALPSQRRLTSVWRYQGLVDEQRARQHRNGP